nr:hypothetical protein CTI12_AA376470 [Tanacetum cinerariifolium]
MNGGSSNNPTESVELLWYEVGTYNYRRIRERTIYLYNKRPKLSSNWFRTSGERSSTKRHNNDTTLLKGGRLFQQYLVDAYTTIEEQRLKWTRNNQDTLRMDLYHYLYDAVTRGDTSETEEGDKCRTPNEIDDTIFVELPSLIHDPEGYKVLTSFNFK